MWWALPYNWAWSYCFGSVRMRSGCPGRTLRIQFWLQASIWEKAAILTPAQESAVDLVSEVCGQRPVPDHVCQTSRLLTCNDTLPAINPGPGSQAEHTLLLHCP